MSVEDIARYLIGIAEIAVHDSRQKLCRIHQLQKRRPVSDYRITSGMGFVERIGSKARHLIEDMLRSLTANAAAQRTVHQHPAVLDYSVNEIRPLLLHDIMLFLAHGTADKIASPERIACKIPDYLHDLFLIDHAAVGVVQYGTKKLRFVFDGSPVLLALQIAGYLFHRARTIQGDACNDILKAVRLHLHHKLCHSCGFKLEHARGIAGAYHLIYPRVVILTVGKIRRSFPSLFGVSAAILYDRERSKPQEVHLEHSKLFKLRHGELSGYDFVISLQGHQIHRRKR